MSSCYAVIIDGVVDNVIVADDDFVVDGATLVKYDNRKVSISPGYFYQDGKFIKQDKEEADDQSK